MRQLDRGQPREPLLRILLRRLAILGPATSRRLRLYRLPSCAGVLLVFPDSHMSGPTEEKYRIRFWKKVAVGAEDECWLWTAAASSTGYGQMKYWKKICGAHRLAYLFSIGPIPEGLVVMHSCDNPACVNPAHLSVGTHKDNIEDRDRKGRWSNQNVNKIECKRGHPLVGYNVKWMPDNSRTCRICHNASQRKCYRSRVAKAKLLVS